MVGQAGRHCRCVMDNASQSVTLFCVLVSDNEDSGRCNVLLENSV